MCCITKTNEKPNLRGEKKLIMNCYQRRRKKFVFGINASDYMNSVAGLEDSLKNQLQLSTHLFSGLNNSFI
jgi:hypothetical protein